MGRTARPECKHENRCVLACSRQESTACIEQRIKRETTANGANAPLTVFSIDRSYRSVLNTLTAPS